jgi:pyruvate dehydrogenase (quinone)
MKKNVSDFLIDRLLDWDVRRIYGFPGDGINPIMAALNRREDDIDFVQVRHEVMAAFMACAHAKFSGDIGVCLATAGPGAIQLLNGLYDAKLDHQPVLAIIGQQARSALGTNYLQDVDLLSLFKDVAHEYVNVATVPSQVRHLIDRSIRIAKSERTVTCLIIPNDIQDMPAVEHPKREHGHTFSGIGYSRPHVVPSLIDLNKAADILNEGEKVAILIGAGAIDAADQVIEVANKLQAGVAKALLGKAALPDSLPFVTGSIGILGTEATHKMMTSCDTLLVIGSNFPYSEFLPKEGQARAVQIDLDARNLSLRYPMDVSLQGDSKDTLSALLPLLNQKVDNTWRTEIENNVASWWKVVEARANTPADPLNPQLVFWEASKFLPADSIISADSGTSTVWYARDLRVGKGMMASVSGGLASMGCAVPYAIAAKFAFPHRPVIAFAGDGAMQMNGNAELLTIAKYWKEWIDSRLIVVVLNNQDLNFVTWEMRAMAGDPKFEASQNIPAFSYADYAQSIGLGGVTMLSPADVIPKLQEAFAATQPIIIDVHCDPNVPPLPSHISLDQAKAFTMSVLKGDPDTPKPLLGSLGQMLSSWLPK